jgi:hypothetical protein
MITATFAARKVGRNFRKNLPRFTTSSIRSVALLQKLLKQIVTSFTSHTPLIIDYLCFRLQ